MSRFSRRDFLHIGSVTMVGGLAGCTSYVSSQEPTLELAGVEVVNKDTNPHTAHVLFTRGGEPIYWKSKHVSAATDDISERTSFDGFPTEPEDAVFFARHDNQQFTERNRHDMNEQDVSCLTLRVQIEERSQSGESYLSVWRSFDTENCESTPSDSDQ